MTKAKKNLVITWPLVAVIMGVVATIAATVSPLIDRVGKPADKKTVVKFLDEFEKKITGQLQEIRKNQREDTIIFRKELSEIKHELLENARHETALRRGARGKKYTQ